MKKIVSILLAIILLVGLMPLSVFAVEQAPAEDDSAIVWERYAEEAAEQELLKEAAAAYKKAAEKYFELAKTDEVYYSLTNRCYNTAIELFKEEGVYDEVVKCFEGLGDAYVTCDKYKEAKNAFANAIFNAKEFNVENSNLRVLYEKLGDALAKLGEYKEAADAYSHAIEETDPSEESYSALRLKYAQALESDGLTDDPEGQETIAKAFIDAAGAFAAKGEAEDAISILKHGVTYYENMGDIDHAKKAYASLIFQLAQANRKDAAASLCFDLYKAYPVDVFTAALLTNIAAPYYESVEDYNSAALAFETAGDCYKELSDVDLAQECYKEAAEYYEKAKNKSVTGSIIAKENISVLILTIVIAVLITVVVYILIKRRKVS